MEHPGARGQCALETVLIMIALVTLVLTFQLLAKTARGFVRSAQISEEKAK